MADSESSSKYSQAPRAFGILETDNPGSAETAAGGRLAGFCNAKCGGLAHRFGFHTFELLRGPLAQCLDLAVLYKIVRNGTDASDGGSGG